MAVVVPVVLTLWGRLLLARMSRTAGSRWEKPENPMLMLSRNAKNRSRSNLKDSMQAIGRVRLSIWLISFHVCPRRKLVITSLLGWLSRNLPSLEVCWCPMGSGATLIALQTMKTSHPSQELSAPTLCTRGSESGDVASGNVGFPSGMEADWRFVSGYCC